MLAKINWTFFFKDEHFDMNMPALLASMGKDIQNKSEQEAGEEFSASSGMCWLAEFWI